MTSDPHADYLRQAQQHFGGPTSNPSPYRSPLTSLSGGGSAREHENIALLPGEESLFSGDFTASPILRHIKTGLVVTKDRVVVRHPQYMFFIVKVGHAETSIPIKDVCAVTSGRVLSRRRVLMAMMTGFFAAIVGLYSLPMLAFGSPVALLGILLALILLAFAAFQAWLARGLALTVGHSGGGEARVDLEKDEYQDMLAANTLIQRLAVGSTASVATQGAATTPVTQVSAPPPQPPVPPVPPVPPTVSAPRPTPPPAPRPAPPAPPPSSGASSAPPSIWRG